MEILKINNSIVIIILIITRYFNTIDYFKLEKNKALTRNTGQGLW